MLGWAPWDLRLWADPLRIQAGSLNIPTFGFEGSVAEVPAGCRWGCLPASEDLLCAGGGVCLRPRGLLGAAGGVCLRLRGLLGATGGGCRSQIPMESVGCGDVD